MRPKIEAFVPQRECEEKESPEADILDHRWAEGETFQVYSDIATGLTLRLAEFQPAQKPGKQVLPRESLEKSRSVACLGNRQRT
jgi:hypothetical protein